MLYRRHAMKTLLTSALTLCLLIAVGCAEGNAPNAETEATIANATNKVELNIEGMDCSGCSGSVVAAVEAIEGVEAATADVASGDVAVALADGVDAATKGIEIEAVLQELQEGKYTVKSITASSPAEGEGTPSEEAPSEEPASDEQANAESDEAFVFTSYKVTGMDCSGCSSQIVNAVKAVDGVQKVEADHATGKVEVAFDDRFDDKTKTDEVKAVIASLSDGKYTVSQ